MTKSLYPTLYIGDLQSQVDELVLYDIFRPFGKLISIRVCCDALTGQSLGYAYVNFLHETDARVALENINLQLIFGSPCRVMWYKCDSIAVTRTNIGNIFINNLDPSITACELFDTFRCFGEIISCKLQTDENHISTGTAFIQYEQEIDSSKAIEVMNKKLLKNRLIYVGNFILRSQYAMENVDFTNCFIKNFGTHLTDESLRNLFEPFGEIGSVKVMTNYEGISLGWGFVNFRHHKSAVEAIKNLHGKFIGNKSIFVGRAITKMERLNGLQRTNF